MFWALSVDDMGSFPIIFMNILIYLILSLTNKNTNKMKLILIFVIALSYIMCKNLLRNANSEKSMMSSAMKNKEQFELKMKNQMEIEMKKSEEKFYRKIDHNNLLTSMIV